MKCSVFQIDNNGDDKSSYESKYRISTKEEIKCSTSTRI